MKHLLGITMGCPVGIGPEIILRFYSSIPAVEDFQPVVLGDLEVMQRIARQLKVQADIVSWRPGEDIGDGVIPVCNITSLDAGSLRWGKPDAETGKATVQYIEAAVRLIEDGVLAGMVTCPISKYGLKMAGCNYPGHTEMLASLTGTEQYLMMMSGSRLRVVLVTIHEPLCMVPELLTKERLSKCIRMTAQALRDDFGMDEPRIAVAGLNPHGGEHGMFGTEEQEIIAPVIAAMDGGAEVSGPWPPDTVFYHASAGRYDAVVAMYHDQGLIPFKLLHFTDGVNVTLGLPIVRTSVDHGTAYDIAGQGVAQSLSLESAFSTAAGIVLNRTKRVY